MNSDHPSFFSHFCFSCAKEHKKKSWNKKTKWNMKQTCAPSAPPPPPPPLQLPLPTRLLLPPSLTHLAKVDTLTPAVHAPAASISLAPTRLRVAPFKRPGPPSSSQGVINACLLRKRPSRLPRLGSSVGGGEGRGLKRTRRVEEMKSRRRKWDGCSGNRGRGCCVQRWIRTRGIFFF